MARLDRPMTMEALLRQNARELRRLNVQLRRLRGQVKPQVSQRRSATIDPDSLDDGT